MKVRDGVIAATISLGSGTDEAVEKAKIRGADDDRVLLFGSSDLLVIARSPGGFEGGPVQVSEDARAANWYFALAVDVLNADEGARPFRGLSFFRLHRPNFDRLSLDRLQEVLDKFRNICAKRNVAAEAMLGYGWADLYIDIRGRTLKDLLAGIVECRAIDLEGRSVFRNSFTIIGIDMKHRAEAEAAREPVFPSIALRIAPRELSSVVRMLRSEFDSGRWQIEITTGKRDVVLTPKAPIEFREFWQLHQRLRERIMPGDSAIYKLETHLQFPPDAIISEDAPPAAANSHCSCAKDAAALHAAFVQDLSDCPDSVGRGQKQSLDGLAYHYRETLADRDSCCDFDAAAAHFYSHGRLMRQYVKMIDHLGATEATKDQSEAIRTRRRLDLYREAFQRLDISSMVIFQQEQNGSYTDLLTRSERVSLFRGGMQKMNTVLLAVLHALVDRYRLSVSPMLCWWPAGQIQSERPIGVIKVPIFFLHQPEIAMFLMIHELGQIAAYEYLRTADDDVDDLRDEFEEEQTDFDPEDHSFLKSLQITLDRHQRSTPEAWLSTLERDSVDTGVLLTDVFADLFLLRVGFADDMVAMRLFLFEQFLQLEQIRDPQAHRGGIAYSVFLLTRMIAMSVAEKRLAKGTATKTPVTLAEVLAARDDALEFLRGAAASERFQGIENFDALMVVLRDRDLLGQATDLVRLHEKWVRKAIEFARQFSAESPAGELSGEAEIAAGEIKEIDRDRIMDYFLRLLDAPQDDPNLFRARAALIASVITSCEPRRRLAVARQALEREAATAGR